MEGGEAGGQNEEAKATKRDQRNATLNMQLTKDEAKRAFAWLALLMAVFAGRCELDMHVATCAVQGGSSSSSK